MKQQTPIPPIKDEAVRKAKRAVFPYLIWGQGEGSIMSKIFPLFWLRLLPCRAGAHVHTVCETQPAVLFPCRCMSMAFSKKKKRKNARSGFEIPYYLCSREPHGLGGLALKNQPSPISFMWTVSLRFLSWNHWLSAQHRNERWLFKSRGSFLHELLPGAIRPNIKIQILHTDLHIHFLKN